MGRLLVLPRVWTRVPGLAAALGPSYVHIVVILVCLTLQ